MILHIARVTGAFALIGMIATSASAQRILDWPLRTTAGPESVARGVEAAYWNPAAIANPDSRGELLIADQRAPAAIGVGGFAVAASWRLDARTTVAGGYQQVSVDDIGETSTSPLPDNGAPSFSVTEDQIAIGVAHNLGSTVTAGGGVRHDRSDESGLSESTTSLSAGFLFTPSLPLRPVLGGSILTQRNGVRFNGGIEIGSVIAKDFDVRGGYGIRGGENTIALEHRIGTTINWRRMVEVTGGFATSDAGGERTYDPVAGVSLRVSRYELGVLREGLASDFGAAYSFRFKVALK